MIYFSSLKGKKIMTEDDVEVGRLEDIIFLASETPTVTKFVVRGILKEKIIIPIKYLEKINNVITVAKDYTISNLEENELYLVKNLLDKQIIDLKGNKIVRVNDVALQDKGGLYITGVDVGILGILRWLRMEDLIFRLVNIFNVKLSSDFLSWGDIQPLELVHGRVKLRRKEEKLEKIRPEDLADYLEKSNVINVRKFLRMLDEERAAAVITKLNLNYQSSLFRHYSSEKASKLLIFVDPDDTVDILLTLPQKKRQEILDFLPKDKREELSHLIRYSTTPIGNLLNSEFITVYPDETAREVIKKVEKETADFDILNNVYVVNKQNQLIGVFNLHELLLQDSDVPIYKFMIQNVITVYLTTPVEIAINRMIKYRLQTLPVVDKNNLIIGIISSLKVIAAFLNKKT